VHCSTFGYRLTSDSDKGMDSAYRNSLRSQCNFNPNNRVPLDAGSQFAFDSSYFANVLANRTTIESDAAHRRQGQEVEEQPRLVQEQLRRRHGQDGRHPWH
jgi:hypothetical protein